MEQYLPHIFIPMIISNILHMIIVKKNILSFLTIPLSRSMFGQNKTLRGLIMLPILNGLLFWAVNWCLPLFGNWIALAIGGILGLVYMIFELPNSWLKRRIGIASGQRAEKNALLFLALDKTDSALGVSLACCFILNFSWLEALYLFLIAAFIHVSFSWLLVITGIKRRF